MKKRNLILASAGAAAAITFAIAGQRENLVVAADHVDGGVVTMTANIGADLTDFYAWRFNDNGTAAMAFIVNANPFAATNAAFPQNVHYVVNLDRGGTLSQIICQFESDDNTAIRCWVGDATDNVILSGDPTSASAPLAMNGIKVFAGPRRDPFFFNLDGFAKTTDFVHAAAVAGTLDGLVNPTIPGCFDLDVDHEGGLQVPATIGGALVNCLSTMCNEGVGQNGNVNAVDTFAAANVLSLVVSVPVASIPGNDPLIKAYASTHSR